MRFILFALMLYLSGCIIIPVPRQEPYQEKELASIHPGETTRQEVVRIFGRPYTEREHNTIWIYGESRPGAVILVFFSTLDAGTLDDYQYLVVEFDQDTVKHFELIEDRWGCSSTGICLRGGWDKTRFGVTKEGLYPEDQGLIVSKRADDQKAKEFRSVSNKCSLYIYSESGWPRRTAVDSTKNILIDLNSYLRFLLESDPRIVWMTRHDKKGEVMEKRITCGKGEVVFVKLYAKKISTFVREVRAEAVDADEGRKEIMRRYLILLP